MDWISVEDRLPENHQHVIASDGEDVSELIYFKNNNHFETDEGTSLNYTVTHWMPLPKPPAKR